MITKKIKDADFNLDEFIESFQNYILRQEQAHSSNALSTQETLPSLTNNCCQLSNESYTTQHCPLSEKQSRALENKLS